MPFIPFDFFRETAMLINSFIQHLSAYYVLDTDGGPKIIVMNNTDTSQLQQPGSAALLQSSVIVLIKLSSGFKTETSI